MGTDNLYASYRYDDPDFRYTYPNSETLRNLFNERDPDKLTALENQIFNRQALLLIRNPIAVNSMEDVQAIHRFLYGRTQRKVLRVLALSKSYRLSIHLATDSTAYDLYMLGTINSDLAKLKEVKRSNSHFPLPLLPYSKPNHKNRGAPSTTQRRSTSNFQ